VCIARLALRENRQAAETAEIYSQPTSGWRRATAPLELRQPPYGVNTPARTGVGIGAGAQMKVR
jgi:hypothetical protein